MSLGGSLAPGFLIASPPLGDPNFDRTVVLLALHNDGGALGFVVNRPAPMELAELLSLAGYGDEPLHGRASTTQVLVGGPVQPGSGWILCADPDMTPDGASVLAVGDRVRVTSSKTAFDALALEAKESRSERGDEIPRVVLLGYSGWGPGQLEGEIAAGAWIPVPLDERVLFDTDANERWERAYAIVGLSPAAMMTMRSAGDA